MGFVELARTGEIADGGMKKVVVKDRELLLARAGSRFFATDARCPHLAGDLSEGILAGTMLTCPVHHSQFDIRNGRVIRWTDLTGIKPTLASRQCPPHSLRTYLVQVTDGKIFVALD